MTATINFSDVLSRAEAAEYLRVCKTTLDRLDIPRTQVRRRVLFKKTVLDAWLDAHTAPSTEHPAKLPSEGRR
jgi:excisionase family DNA binding protein